MNNPFLPEKLRVDAHVELKAAGLEDVPVLFSLISRHREDLHRWLDWANRNYTLSDLQMFIRNAIHDQQRGMGMEYIIRYKQTCCGAIGIHRMHEAVNHVEIGYWLAPPFRGKGIITRSVQRLVDACFLKDDIDKVVIRCAGGNVKSRSVAERLGFHLENMIPDGLRIAGTLHSLYIYGLSRTTCPDSTRGNISRHC